MFAFPNMFHFFAHEFARLGGRRFAFAHEFARLGGRRFAFAFVFARPFDWFFFWHSKIVSPLARYLDVTKSVSHICIYRYYNRATPILPTTHRPSVQQRKRLRFRDEPE